MTGIRTPRVKPISTTKLVKNLVSKYWYPYVSRRLNEEDIVFLNYGYEEDPPMGLALESSDEPSRYGIQLYHCTASQADLSDKKVLEVSCGHGGGASYLVRTFHPASYTALDYNADGITYCKKRHNLPGLDFVHGNAESLPFPDESFDAVVNVEASHAYPEFPRFLSEVARVLRPGGHFLYADFRGQPEIPEWEEALAAAPLRLLSERIINPEVVRGMEKNSARYLELVDHLPVFLRPFGRLFAGVPGTLMHREVERGGISYRMYSYTKD